MPQPSLTKREIGGEVGQHELNALELDDPPARLPALVDVEDGILEGGARDAERVRGDTRARLVERGEQHRKPGPRLAEQIGARHAQSSKASAAVDEARCPILSSLREHLEARSALSENERGDRPAVVGDARPFAEHEDQVGNIAAGDEGLAAGYERCRRPWA